jgi:hypothetical protein
MIESFFLMFISIASFYPILYFLNKQVDAKLGRRMFDQILIMALMILTFAHFISEQKVFSHSCFIPMANWHKLINVLLLIEQCSLVLLLGKLSGSLTQDTEATLFGINLVLILIMQEKDSVHG